MAHFELNVFANDSELAHAVAAAWLDEVADASQNHRSHYVALSGGRIAREFFAAAADLAGARQLPLNAVHFFWADERCVPPEDPESNYRLARELLFLPLNIPGAHVHRVRGEMPPDAAATEANAEIRRIAPLNADGQPMLDLILLGMGEDGHVASLFPGEPAEVYSDKAVYRVIRNSPKPPALRVTLGYATLAAARQVWALTSGAGKTAALRASLAPTGQTPLARVLQSRPRTRIFSASSPD